MPIPLTFYPASRSSDWQFLPFLSVYGTLSPPPISRLHFPFSKILAASSVSSQIWQKNRKRLICKQRFGSSLVPVICVLCSCAQALESQVHGRADVCHCTPTVSARLTCATAHPRSPHQPAPLCCLAVCVLVSGRLPPPYPTAVVRRLLLEPPSLLSSDSEPLSPISTQRDKAGAGLHPSSSAEDRPRSVPPLLPSFPLPLFSALLFCAPDPFLSSLSLILSTLPSTSYFPCPLLPNIEPFIEYIFSTQGEGPFFTGILSGVPLLSAGLSEKQVSRPSRAAYLAAASSLRSSAPSVKGLPSFPLRFLSQIISGLPTANPRDRDQLLDFPHLISPQCLTSSLNSTRFWGGAGSLSLPSGIWLSLGYLSAFLTPPSLSLSAFPSSSTVPQTLASSGLPPGPSPSPLSQPPSRNSFAILALTTLCFLMTPRCWLPGPLDQSSMEQPLAG